MELILAKLLNFLSVKICLPLTFVARTEKKNVFSIVWGPPPSCCCDEILWQQQLQEGWACSGSWFKSMVHHGGVVKATAAWRNWLHHIHNQEAEGNECMLVSAQLAFFILYSPGYSSQRIVLLTFKMDLPISISAIKILPQACLEGCLPSGSRFFLVDNTNHDRCG